MVSTTVEMIEGIKKMMRKVLERGIFLYMKNAERKERGKMTKSLSAKKRREFLIALPITLPGEEKEAKNSL